MLPVRHRVGWGVLPLGGGVALRVVLVLMLVCPAFSGLAQAPQLVEADGDTAFRLVEGWVRQGAVPKDDAVLKSPVSGPIGVQVTLRDQGRLLGQGSALRPDIRDCVDQAGPAVDLNALLAQATRAALSDALEKQKRRAVELEIVQPELFEQMMRELHGRLLVDVQVGYRLESILLAPNSPDDAVFAHFAPGYHGLRMTGPLMPEGDVIWPGSALSRNTSPLSQIRQLLTRQGFDEQDIPITARPGGPLLQRFSVLHIVRPQLDQPPRLLTRGNLIIGQQILDGRTLDGVVERVARHLESKIAETNQPGERMVRGPYHPSYDRINPDLAEPRQVALLCYAMMLNCETLNRRDPKSQAVNFRTQIIADVIRTYSPTALPENGPPNHLTTAFFLMALNHSPTEVDQALRRRLADALLAMRHPEGGFRSAPGSDTRLSRATAAVLTAALADHYAATGDKRFGDAAWQAFNELVAANQDDPRVVDLMWLSIAFDTAGQRLAEAADTPEALEQLAALRAFLADQTGLLIDQQIKTPPLMGPSDVVGGFILNPGPVGSPPNPTWESAMPLTIIALSLRDEAVVPRSRVFGPILAAGLGARFLSQLMLTPTNGYYLRNVDQASGGVRNALWDNTLYLDCSSMSLLALTQFQNTLDLLKERENPAE